MDKRTISAVALIGLSVGALIGTAVTAHIYAGYTPAHVRPEHAIVDVKMKAVGVSQQSTDNGANDQVVLDTDKKYGCIDAPPNVGCRNVYFTMPLASGIRLGDKFYITITKAAE